MAVSKTGGTSFNLVTYLQSMQERIRQLETKVASVGYTDYNVPKSDSFGTLSSNVHTTNSNLRIVTGAVIDSMAAYGWYNVQIDDSSYVSCELLAETSAAITGVRTVGGLAPGTKVYVILNAISSTGVILGSYNGFSVGVENDVHDYISQAAANSPGVDGFLKHYANRLPQLFRFSRSSPIDETTIGEWGKLSESGVGFFADPFMAFMRADENCGFWAFWHDQLARIHGHNLQIRSAAMDVYSFNDEDELSVITGYSPYLWESLGGLSPTKLALDRDPTLVQLTQSEFAATDLLTKGQVPFHRLKRFDGFLGQGFKQQLVIPPQNTSSPVYSLPDPGNPLTVWEEHLALDGNYHMVSSQGILLAHVPPFASPVQTRLPEDKTGDNREDGYAPGGYAAGSSESNQKIKEGVAGATTLEGPNMASVADDELAYGMRWRSEHPFHYHTRDWTAPVGSLREFPQGYNELSSSQYLTKPQATPLKVDHREQANYHHTMSMVGILRDGTVVISGPGGEEIRMGGGSIEISCPGDVVLRPGRNVISMAGRDAVIKANRNVEISATNEDVRIKADRNTQILAGNSGTGALLLESKSKQIDQDYTKTGSEVISNGVIVKSASTLACLAGDLYLRAGLGTSYGSITLDAAKGKGSIITSARDIANYISVATVDYFGQPGDVTASNVYTKDQTFLSGSLISLSNNPAVFGAGAIFRDNVIIANGNILAELSTGMVPSINEEGKKIINSYYENIKDRNKEIAKDGKKVYKQVFTEYLYAKQRIGNDTVVKTAGFSFRSSEQSRASDFMLYESRWAQRARMNGEGTNVWVEKPVQANENKTYPFPGEEAWTGQGYRKINTSLYVKGSNGIGPVAAGPDYESASIENQPEPVSLEGNYPVIV
jgi:hypothetical protein